MGKDSRVIQQNLVTYDEALLQMIEAVKKVKFSLNSMQNHPDIKDLDSHVVIGSPKTAAAKAVVVGALQAIKALEAAESHMQMSLKFFKEVHSEED